MHTSRKRHDGPLRSPPPASACEWWGGVGGGGRLCAIAPPPTRRAACRRRATLPTASRGEGWCPQLRLCPLQRCVHALARKRGPSLWPSSRPWIPAFAGMNGDWFNGGANLNSSCSRFHTITGIARQRSAMVLRTILCALSMLSLSARGAKQAVANPCEHRAFEGDGFVVCTFDAQTQKLRLAWKSIAGTPYRSFAALSHEVDEGKLAFAMNAGMYDQAGSPIGLYVEQARELKSISIAAGRGNFYMKPNGVFWIDADSDPHVSATDDYIAAARQPAWATQSGPMLVI